jgi:hypothetical protein
MKKALIIASLIINQNLFAQNVGIGTTLPQEKLHIDSGALKIGRTTWNQAVNHMLKFGDGSYVTIAENGADDRMELAANEFVFRNINGTGNVGIGTITAPTSKLEVNGQIKITGGLPGLNKVLTSDANGLASWQLPVNSGVNVWTTNGVNIYNNNTGNIGLQGNSSPVSPLSFSNTVGNKINLFNHSATEIYGFGMASGTLQHYVPATSKFSWGLGNHLNYTERMQLTGAGNLGIGTVPSYKLDVDGRMRLRHNSNTAGLWLNNVNNTEAVFSGMYNDTIYGIYGANTGWEISMDAKNGRVGIGIMNPKNPLSFPPRSAKRFLYIQEAQAMLVLVFTQMN